MQNLDVPFSSQYADMGHHEWRARGCGIASLHMVMAYWHRLDAANRLPELDELLTQGRALGAYREGIGWSHGGLVQLASRYGYEGFNADDAPNGPTPKSVQASWSALEAELAHGPIMASVYAGLDPKRGGGHIIVVTGSHDGLVSFNDPEEMDAREGLRSLSHDVFLAAFKRRYIVIRPSGHA